MGDHRLDVEARRQHGNHLVPGLEHLAAVDRLDGQSLEYDLRPFYGRLAGRDAHQRDLAAHDHHLDHLPEGGGGAAHLHADVESLGHFQPGHDVVEVLLFDVDRPHIGKLRCQFETERINVGDDNVAGPDMAGHGGSHDADRAGTGDQHILADQIERQGSVHGIAQGIHNRRQIIADLIRQLDDVKGGYGQIFGKGTGSIDPDPSCVRSEMEMPGPRGPALVTHQMALPGHPQAFFQALDMIAQTDDLADIFMADDHRHRDGRGGPFVPIVNMNIGAADRGFFDLDEHIVGTRLGYRLLLHPQARLRLRLDERFHGRGLTHSMTPKSLPTFTKASTARSICCTE